LISSIVLFAIKTLSINSVTDVYLKCITLKNTFLILKKELHTPYC